MVWMVINHRERHLKLAGKVLGKIQKRLGETFWTAILNSQPRRYLGTHESESEARQLVEKEVAQWHGE